jgi:hypothetical protein
MMKLDPFLQLVFGLVATVLTLTGLWFKIHVIKSIIHMTHRTTVTDVMVLACFRRIRRQPLLPLYTTGTPPASRRSTYLMEMNITQDWIGQHAAGWSVGLPRMHRVADA